MSSNLVPQILPNFVTQRALYEARERPAKIYSWQVFILSNIHIELPWNALMAVLVFVSGTSLSVSTATQNLHTQ
jgi:ATP-binding cassette subfamily G (WHITE) protein 2 (PDR)